MFILKYLFRMVWQKWVSTEFKNGLHKGNGNFQTFPQKAQNFRISKIMFGLLILHQKFGLHSNLEPPSYCVGGDMNDFVFKLAPTLIKTHAICRQSIYFWCGITRPSKISRFFWNKIWNSSFWIYFTDV